MTTNTVNNQMELAKETITAMTNGFNSETLESIIKSMDKDQLEKLLRATFNATAGKQDSAIEAVNLVKENLDLYKKNNTEIYNYVLGAEPVQQPKGEDNMNNQEPITVPEAMQSENNEQTKEMLKRMEWLDVSIRNAQNQGLNPIYLIEEFNQLRGEYREISGKTLKARFKGLADTVGTAHNSRVVPVTDGILGATTGIADNGIGNILQWANNTLNGAKQVVNDVIDGGVTATAHIGNATKVVGNTAVDITKFGVNTVGTGAQAVVKTADHARQEIKMVQYSLGDMLRK